MTFWFLGALEIWRCSPSWGCPSGYPEALVIESLTQAVRGAAFAIPGALGAQEGGFLAICAIFGVPAGRRHRHVAHQARSRLRLRRAEPARLADARGPGAFVGAPRRRECGPGPSDRSRSLALSSPRRAAFTSSTPRRSPPRFRRRRPRRPPSRPGGHRSSSRCTATSRRLCDDLASFFAQDYPAPSRSSSACRSPTTRRSPWSNASQAAFPEAGRAASSSTPAAHGANPKIANLDQHGAGRARYECLGPLRQRHRGAEPTTCARVAAALAEPGVGIVTCLYRGVAATGFWSQLVGAGDRLSFPARACSSACALGLATPCFGSTIALRRAT